MDALEMVLFVLISLALVLSCVALVLVFAWRKTTPEIQSLRNHYQSLSLAQADLADRLSQWMSRDSARWARDKKRKPKWFEDEESESTPEQSASPTAPEQLPTLAERKQALRLHVMGRKI